MRVLPHLAFALREKKVVQKHYVFFPEIVDFVY